MIRRNPTLIAMSDLDVQDVREHVRSKKETAMAASILSSLSQAPVAGRPGAGTSVSGDPSKPVVHAEEAKRKREAMTKEERLGV